MIAIAEIWVISFAVFLAWLFAHAGLHKLRDGDACHRVLRNYVSSPAVSSLWLRWLRMTLVILECMLALGLLFPPIQRLALAVAGGVLLLYAAAMIVQMASGRGAVDCGCGTTRLNISPALVSRNVLLAALALALALLPVQPMIVNTQSLALVLILVVFMVLLHLCCNQIMSNARQFSRAR